jgi:hypothetical protein
VGDMYEKISELAQGYAGNFKSVIDLRSEEMKLDDNSH